MVARGEIWWHEHPVRERRPYLILTRNEAIPLLNQVLAVPATTTIRGIPTEVALGRHDGMPRKCVLSFDNATLIRTSLCTTRITSLSPQKMTEVCEALKLSAGCP